MSRRADRSVMMRKMRGRAAVLALLALVAMPAGARAQQLDTNPPIPNVLLLIDNSGSMDREIDGSLPEDNAANNCNCNATTGVCNWSASPAQVNRWGTVVQAMTGTLANGYNCASMPRTPGSVFAQEYAINGNAPYDLNYYINFHRMVAQDTSSSPSVPCVIAPGTLAGAASGQGVGSTKSGNPAVPATAFFSGDVVSRPYDQLATTTSTCQFQQIANGAIDTMTNLIRFGMMTFDQDPGAGTGVTGPSTNLAVSTAPFTGMWSYFPGWNGVGSTSYWSGFPAGCTTPQLYVVGSRNPAAPPWEGRMVGFPTGSTTQQQNNTNIDEVIRATRPYGGTPLAGMLTDAQYYFQTDPSGPFQTDPYVQGGCRQQNIIILTDGAPNEDMRPGCQAATGSCPFLLPEQIASNLFTTTLGSQVVTYVIGFAMASYSDPASSGTCSSLVNSGALSSSCNPSSNSYASSVLADGVTPNPNYDANLAACCELEKIAIAGGSGQAYFADSPGDLQSALGSILGRIAQQATTRSVPAYSPVVTNVIASATTPNQDIFYASFTPSVGQPWSGDIQRSRFFCSSSSSSGTSSSASSSGSSSTSSSASSNSPLFNAQEGDDFAQNLNSTAGFNRTFIAFEPALTTSSANGWNSIRPFIAAAPPDGVTTYGATTVAGPAATVINNVQPAAISGINTASTQGCPYTPNNALGTQYMTPSQCLDEVFDFTFAQPASSFSGPPNFTFSSRFGNAFGDIYHATPMVVGPPGSLLEDPSYQAFQMAWSNNVKCGTNTSGGSGSTGSPRPTTVYAATNDGLLHAFWADETTLENNEQWAMLMPEAYQNVLATYPSNHMQLLDGSPVVKDVVFDRNAAVATSNTASAWHTMLVAGYGPQQQGYYAVDVTDPCPPPSGVTTSGTLPPSGPVFRWQLTTMPSTNYPIFGEYAATPAITTLFMNPDNTLPRDIGVAILPGGWNGPPPAVTQCTRQPKSASNLSTPQDGGYVSRSSVQCWGGGSSPGTNTPVIQNAGANYGGRSVAIVRLDTGEIIRVFASPVDTAPYPNDTLAAKNRITSVPFDSPMTGTPVVYPSDVGSDATKFFIGDADGTLWRFNVSDPNPANWTATLFLDLYNTTVDTSATSWQDGQPLEVAPVVSLNSANQVVINAATGTTESFNNSGTYYVYSITETPQGTGTNLTLNANVNWYFGPQSSPSTSPSSTFRPGERVSGPMTVFNGSLFFSSYYAGNQAVASCSSGDARIWGMDFETPYAPSPSAPCTANPNSCRGNGGVFTLNTTSGYVDVGATFPGRVVPGVAVQATPACGTLTAAQDNYIGGTVHQVTSSFTPGSFSLVGLVGGVGASNGMAENPFSISLPTPTAPTLINSWAAVLE